jgi:chaperone required for assembly of F1-ATPase
MSDRTSHTSDFTEFSIPSNLSEFSGIRFTTMTGRVVRSQDRSHTTRSGKNTITERTQKIWLRRSNGKEEYLELDDAVTGQIRQGHLITVVYAQTKIRQNCVAVWIDELEQYFCHNTNVNGAIIDTCIFKSRLPTLDGIKNRVLVPGTNPWKIAAIVAVVAVLCGSYLVGILILSGSLLLPMFVLTKANPETCLNLIVIATSNHVNKKRLLNHIDRIFGHQLIEY